MKKHFAFTLAEVLIALTIIGVISVLTVPSLITNVDNQTNMTKLKKAYGVLNQVVGIEMGESGEDCVSAPQHTTQGVNMAAGLASIIAKNVAGIPINGATNAWKASDGLIYVVDTPAANCTNYNVSSPAKCGVVKIVTKGNSTTPSNWTTLDDSNNLTGGAGFELPYYRNGIAYPTSDDDLMGLVDRAQTTLAAGARVIYGTVGKDTDAVPRTQTTTSSTSSSTSSSSTSSSGT